MKENNSEQVLIQTEQPGEPPLGGLPLGVSPLELLKIMGKNIGYNLLLCSNYKDKSVYLLLENGVIHVRGKWGNHIYEFDSHVTTWEGIFETLYSLDKLEKVWYN